MSRTRMWVVLILGAIIAVALFALSNASKSADGNSTTNYFGLSCDDLKTRINSTLSDAEGGLYDKSFSYAHEAQDSAYAAALLNLFQIKGCIP